MVMLASLTDRGATPCVTADRSHMILVVGGCGKSGTTLLQAVLSASENCNPLIGECGYVYYLVSAYTNAMEHWPEEAKFLFTDPGNAAHFTRVTIERLLNGIRQRYACDHVVIKSPRLTPLLPIFCQLLRGVVPVVIVRDPLDVVAASVQAERPSCQPEARRLIRRFAQRYVVTYQPLIEAPEVITLVKYEELVTRPLPVIDALSQLIGLPSHFDSEDPWKGSEFTGNLVSASRSDWHSSMWTMPLSSSRIGSYRDTLSATDISTVSEICASMCDYFGYS